jgi:hypothetical protein
MEIKIKVYFLNDNLNNDYNQYKSAKEYGRLRTFLIIFVNYIH